MKVSLLLRRTLYVALLVSAVILVIATKALLFAALFLVPVLIRGIK